MSVFKYYLLVVAISILPFIGIFLTADLPHTHDGLVHLPRMAAYYKALAGGQILPRWASDLNYGYGMPLFNFIYHTPYLLSTIFIFTGLSLVLSFKLVLLLSFILSGIAMLACTLELFENRKKALLVTLFYQFAPFRLIELLTRGSFGEVYTYAFLPMILYGLLKINKKPTVKNIGLTSIATGLLIISHNSISLIFFAVILLFLLFFTNKKNILYSAISLTLGLGLSAFYWLPALLEHKYTYGDLFMKDIFREHFPPFVNFFIPNFVNSKTLQTLGISVQFGLLHTFAIAIVFYTFFIRKKLDVCTKKVFIFSFILIGVSLFLMHPISTFFWEKFRLLRQFQFPWRLLSVTSFATAFVSVSFFSLPLIKKQWVFIILLIGVVGSTVLYWNPPLGFDKITDEKKFWDYPLTTTYWGETDVIWMSGPAKQYAKQPFEAIEGDANFSEIKKGPTVHTVTVTSTAEAKIVDNTEYFPGWRARVNNTKVPIEFQNQNWRGLITFTVPKGTSHVEVAFEKSPIQKIGEYISLASIISIAISLFTFKRKSLS